MADHLEEKKHHFIFDGFVETERFSRPKQRVLQGPIPERDRHSHGTNLLGQIDVLKSESETADSIQADVGFEGGFGLQVEFNSFPDVELAFESLARERSGIELLNVRHDTQRTYATVFVPDGKLKHFEGLVLDYLNEKHDRIGRVRDHKNLINTIEQIRAASL